MLLGVGTPCLCTQLQVREILTKTLQALPGPSRAAGSIRAMCTACRRFLDEPMPDFRNLARWPGGRHAGDEEGNPSFFVALGELRATFGTHIAALAYQPKSPATLANVWRKVCGVTPSSPHPDRRATDIPVLKISFAIGR